MEERTRESKKGFLIFELIIIILIISCCVTILYLTNETKNNKKILNNLDNTYNEKEKTIDEKNKELEETNKKLDKLNSDIKSYTDIDKSIEETKKEYFAEIKKVEDEILSGKSDRKIAYLTFDDGPYYNTYKVLDILDKYNVKATFFTISANGQYCFDNKSYDCYKLYSEYVKRGHTIANHTYTHGIFKGLYNSADTFMNAIDMQEKHIMNLTGYKTNITRFPGGSSTAGRLKNSIIERLRKKGYGWVDWSAEDGDGKGIPSEQVAWSNLKATVNSDIEVILFHDYNKITTSILPDVIKYLSEKGYEMYPLFYESNMVKK